MTNRFTNQLFNRSLVITTALALIAGAASGLFWLRTNYQHAVGNHAVVASLLKCDSADLRKLLPGNSPKNEVLWQNHHGYGYIRFTATAQEWGQWTAAYGKHVSTAPHTQLVQVPTNGRVVEQEWDDALVANADIKNRAISCHGRWLVHVDLCYSPSIETGVCRIFAAK